MKKDKKVTLKDIAEEADVSMMTVSNVLNGRGSVSSETSVRIRDIAQRLNYRPNQVARSLRIKETKTLGVVVSDSSQLVLAKVVRAIEEEAARAGYSVIVANTDQNPAKEKAAVELLLNKRIDGLMLAAPLCTDAAYMMELVSFGVPLVLLMRTSESQVSSVVNDNEQGGYEIVRYLLQKKRQPIHFISLPEGSQSGQSRIRGYHRAMAESGLTLTEQAMQYCQPTIEAGHEAMNRLLEQGIKQGAVCCGCDLIAIGAIRAIQEKGLTIPEDLAVTGYDDIDLADYLRVPLTTISQPKEEMGRTGVALLLEQIRGTSHQPRWLVLPGKLMIRCSA